jgi:ATP-dependent RNA helicase DeaD
VNENSAAESTAAAESSSVSGFATLKLNDAVLRALIGLGYEVPTPIQAATIPPLLGGADLVGQAQTGTGKTAAFALPVLSKIDLGRMQPQALVLVPTRELAIQVAEAFQSYAAHLQGFHVLPIYGGQSYTPQIKGLKRGAHVVVGTPGRVMDHMKRGTLDLAGLTTLVLDEADEMLQMGFIDDIEWVLEQTPPTRQVVLFSATLPAQIRRIAQKHLRNPVEITIKTKTTTAANIRQRYWLVSGMHKLDALTRILEVETFDGMLIFVRTKLETVELAERLQARGFNAAALNGDIHQQQRERTINALKTGDVDIVVATDVAARGLDVERVSHVVNYDVPYDSESYVHRVGRTGRAGRKGEAILFIAPRERNMLRIIERATRQPIEQMRLPSIADVNEQRVGRFKQRISEAVTAGEGAAYRDLIEQFEAENEIPAIEIAAALASLAQGGEPLLLPEKPEGWGGSQDSQRRGRDEGREDSRRGRRDDRFEGRSDRPARRERDDRFEGRGERPARGERVEARGEARADRGPGGERSEARGEAQVNRGERSERSEPRGDARADQGERGERVEARGEARADQGERGERFEASGEAQADRGERSEQLVARDEAQPGGSERFEADGEAQADRGQRSVQFEGSEAPARSESGAEVSGQGDAPDFERPARRERDDKFDAPPRKKRGPEGISFETFKIEVGHVHGVKPGNIVGAIANEAGLEGRHIGHVDIHEDHSFVDLPEGMPKEIFRSLKQVRVMGQELNITYASGKPNSGGKRQGRGGKAARPEHAGAEGESGQLGEAEPVGEGEFAGAAEPGGPEGRGGGHDGGPEGRGDRDERPRRPAGPEGRGDRDERPRRPGIQGRPGGFGRKFHGAPGGAPRREFGGPPREGGYAGGPPREGGYAGGPPREGGYAGGRPPRQGGYAGGPPREGGYAGGRPPREGGYAGGRPPREGGYAGGPPREGGFGGGQPPRGGGYAGPGSRPGPGSRGPKGGGGFKRHAGPKGKR